MTEKNSQIFIAFFSKDRKKEDLRIFCLAFVCAVLSFLPVLVSGHGLVTLFNDYHEQSIPFHILMSRCVHSGQTGWNHSIDLGSELTGARAYYGIGSPFTWMEWLVPSGQLIYFMPFVLCLRIAAATLNAFWYLRYHQISCRTAAACAMTYGFSGYIATDLIFYNFLDGAVFFPLLLLSADCLIDAVFYGSDDRFSRNFPFRITGFTFAVCLNAAVNYYLFVEEALFLFLYFICRVICCPANGWGEKWRKTGRLLLQFLLEGFLGVCLVGVILVPAFLNLLGNPRIGHKIATDHFFDFSRRYLLKLFRAFVFPAETMGINATIEEADFSSMAGYLPMIGVVPVLIFLLHPLIYRFKAKRIARTAGSDFSSDLPSVQSTKKNLFPAWLWLLLVLLFWFVLIPVLNSAFGVFADSNYKRWYFCLLLLMALASAYVLDEPDILYRYRFVPLMMLIIMMGSAAAFHWWDQNRFQLIFQSEQYKAITAEGIVGMGILTAHVFLCVRQNNSQERNLRRAGFLHKGLLLSAAVMSCLTMGTTAWFYQKGSGEKPEDYFARVQSYTSLRNVIKPGYRLETGENTITQTTGIDGTGSSDSTVSGRIFEFFDSMGEERAVFTPLGPEGTQQILSAAYYYSSDPQDSRDVLAVDSVVIPEKGSRSLWYRPYVPPIGGYVYQSIDDLDVSETDPSERALTLLSRAMKSDAVTCKVMESKGSSRYEVELTIHAVEGTGLREANASNEEEKNGQLQSQKRSGDGTYTAFFSIPADWGWQAYVNGVTAHSGWR